MPNPRQHRFARPLLRKRVPYGVAALLSTVFLFIGPAMAWADESVTLDFVRHGQSIANALGAIDTSVPGTGLTEIGQQQAEAIAQARAGNSYAGIFASEEIRTQETAAPLAGLLHMNVQMLPGLNEITAGIFEGQPLYSLGGLYYLLAVLSWTLGLDFVPIPGPTTPNGIAFDESFSSAVQTMYDVAVANGGGKLSDVAFSSEFSTVIWTLMNVQNPDFPLILTEVLKTGQLLPNGGMVVVQGSPAGGWTLVSYDGTPVPPASLPTELFVDVRDLITAPQFAAYNIWQAVLTGDPTTIVNAIEGGVGEVGTATAHFPLAVTTDLVDALRDGIPNAVANLGTQLNLDTLLGGFNLGDLSTDLANLLPTIGTRLAGLLAGELGTMVVRALTSF